MINKVFALVVQWIERLTPNESIEVRFLARAQNLEVYWFLSCVL